MCLTEPQCGSDLAQVTTKAEPQGDGTYKITGTKIFISCGEHDMTDNIIHCVLARLPGAPEGTKGISLFLVPKRKVADDMTLGELNGANIGRIEDKMGCHGSSTCEINFEDAEGYEAIPPCGVFSLACRSLSIMHVHQVPDRHREPGFEPHVHLYQHLSPRDRCSRCCRCGELVPKRTGVRGVSKWGRWHVL